MPPIGSVTAPSLIGRQRELAALRALLQSGSGTLLVSGEAGIGKSRLVREALNLATAHGYQILQGACFDRDQAIPFAPFLDLIRGYMATHREAAREYLARTAPHFLQLLPELAPTPLLQGNPLSPALEQRRIFQEITTFLVELAAASPLLIVIEDVHWSDEASLDLLLHLTRIVASSTLMLLVTFRGDERSPALSRFLAESDRRRLADEIALSPLSPSEVALQLRAILDLPRPAGTVFVRSLHGLTGGNPFFVEEVIRSLIAEGAVYPSDDGWQRKPLDQIPVPRSVDDAVNRHTRLLSATARGLLLLAAVAGQRVEFALLQALSDLDEGTLIEAIKELIDAQLIAEISADLFAFRHALTQQVVYAGLLARERRVLHARVVQAIEATRDDQGEQAGATLAHHAFEAGDWERAGQLSRLAGARSHALHAPYAAVGHYSRALEADENLGRAADASLLLARAQVHDALGDFAATQADYEAALTASAATNDQGVALAAMLGLGLLWSGRDYAQAHAWLLRAVDLARTFDDPGALAHALNRLGNWHANQENVAEAERCHNEALAIFERLGDTRGLAETYDLMAMTQSLGGDLLGSQHAARHAVELFSQLDDKQGLAGVLILTAAPAAAFELATMVGTASIDDGLAAGKRALALAREIDWRSGEAFLLALLGEVLAAGGQFGRALLLLEESIVIAEELDHRQWMVQARWGLARLSGTMLDPARERAELERVLALAREIRSPIWIGAASATLASTLVAQGDLDAAATLLADEPASDMAMQTQGQRLRWLARAELALGRGRPDESQQIIDRLYAATVNLNAESDVPRLALTKAMALADLGQVGQAMTLLRASLTTAQNQGALPTVRLLHVELAKLAQLQGRDEEASAEEAAAREIAQRLAATLPAGELRAEFSQRAGLAVGISNLTQGAPDAPLGNLTPREQEVARHIAAGHTNRQIADALFVSERTVEAHVTNILRKLSLTSRAGIASWVAQRRSSPDAT